MSGSNNEKYNVLIDVERPRSSICDCPYAKDKRIICKHKVALYFSVFPEEAKTYLELVEENEKEHEEYKKQLYEKVERHIRSKMTKPELQASLTHMLDIAPEWVYDQFVRYYVD